MQTLFGQIVQFKAEHALFLKKKLLNKKKWKFLKEMLIIKKIVFF